MLLLFNLMIMRLSLLLLITLLLCAACAKENQPPTVKKNLKRDFPVYTYEIVNTYPHDPDAFTQGLYYYQGYLYESTGIKGLSSLRKVELETGKVLQKIDVPKPYFAEGMTIYQGKIYQVTWMDSKGFIYDINTFEKLGEFSYRGEGWGLTHNDQYLIISNGTDNIHYLDPTTFEIKKSLKTRVFSLNELELINGHIFANVLNENHIFRFDPETGKVLGLIDLSGLRKEAGFDVGNEMPGDKPLNGIAYDKEKDRLFVTGKFWPKLFEIRLKEQ